MLLVQALDENRSATPSELSVQRGIEPVVTTLNKLPTCHKQNSAAQTNLCVTFLNIKQQKTSVLNSFHHIISIRYADVVLTKLYRLNSQSINQHKLVV